jgi:heme/copper-type cytochrome/quinol oxidase subunit 1
MLSNINNDFEITHNSINYNPNNYKVDSLEWTLNCPPDLHTFEKGIKVVTTNQEFYTIRDPKHVASLDEKGIPISGKNYNHLVLSNLNSNLKTNVFYNSKHKETNITVDYNLNNKKHET